MADWTAPTVDRAEPDLQGPERQSLEQWLDYHRATLLHKCSGLTHDQLKQQSVPTSGLTLLGILRHMTDVERWVAEFVEMRRRMVAILVERTGQPESRIVTDIDRDYI